MPREVNVHEAKTHLSRLLAEVEQGEEVVIGRAGKPVARLVPFHLEESPRAPGVWRGRGHVPDEFFDDLPDEVAAAFRGERP